MLQLTNLGLWLQLVTGLATAVATASGNAPKELRYLNLLTEGVRLTTLTDTDLAELQQRIEAEKAGGVETTEEELVALEERLLNRSAEIQSS